MRNKRFTLEHAGAGILIVGAFITSFITSRHQWLFLIFLVAGLIVLGVDAYKKGKLKPFLWMNLVYLLLFATLIFITMTKGS